ncbi:hypothetical protein ACFPOU_15930 [Massilia jejuensis]|uniref:Uncharacterized protein n=1 Tax=Massilia jejuensis TaxID=648894 RepID=A0ABW0PIZ4_9BURK
MSSIEGVQAATPVPQANLLNNAAAFLRKIGSRLVVPVASTEDMNQVWRIYRLRPGADTARPARTGAADR